MQRIAHQHFWETRERRSHLGSPSTASSALIRSRSGTRPARGWCAGADTSGTPQSPRLVSGQRGEPPLFPSHRREEAVVLPLVGAPPHRAQRAGRSACRPARRAARLPGWPSGAGMRLCWGPLASKNRAAPAPNGPIPGGIRRSLPTPGSRFQRQCSPLPSPGIDRSERFGWSAPGGKYPLLLILHIWEYTRHPSDPRPDHSRQPPLPSPPRSRAASTGRPSPAAHRRPAGRGAYREGVQQPSGTGRLSVVQGHWIAQESENRGALRSTQPGGRLRASARWSEDPGRWPCRPG